LFLVYIGESDMFSSKILTKLNQIHFPAVRVPRGRVRKYEKVVGILRNVELRTLWMIREEIRVRYSLIYAGERTLALAIDEALGVHRPGPADWMTPATRKLYLQLNFVDNMFWGEVQLLYPRCLNKCTGMRSGWKVVMFEPR
jgi:hypothetical protein